MPKSRWTNEQLRVLRSMIESKELINEIAFVLGKSRRCVQLKMRELGISNGVVGEPLDVVRAGVILDSLLIGRSIVKTAKLMKRSYNSIRYTVKRLEKLGMVIKIDGRYTVTDMWEERYSDETTEYRIE